MVNHKQLALATLGSFHLLIVIFTGEEVDSGYVKMSIKYRNFIPIMSKTIKVCEMVKYLGINCPVEAGVQEFSLTQGFPSYALAVRVGIVHWLKPFKCGFSLYLGMSQCNN